MPGPGLAAVEGAAAQQSVSVGLLGLVDQLDSVLSDADFAILGKSGFEFG